MRMQVIKEKMIQENLDSFLVTDMKNIYYLTGFSGTAGTVLLTDDNQYLMTDSRYIEVARQIVHGFELIETRDVLSVLKKFSIKTLGFEDTIDYAFYKKLSTLSIVKLCPTTNFFQSLRQIKDKSEIETIRKACQISDLAFGEVLNFIKPGKTEIEVANFLDFKMREHGASGVSFDTIVASGKRSALPHGVATTKVIEFGDALTMDFGCFYDHYASDMTRTVFVGEADSKLVEIYNVVCQANASLIDKARSGLSYCDYDKIPRDIIETAGYGDYFTHGIGHGVGLDIHEIPCFNQKMTDQFLKERMVITDEPGIYLPKFGGVRIEDDLLITASGVEVLTRSSKDLIVI